MILEPRLTDDLPPGGELRLTVRDAGNLTDMKSLLLYPRTVDLSFTSDPSGSLRTMS